MNQTGSTVQSLDRVFDIVETLSNHGNELSISQLCAFTGLNKSTVHRMLASLRVRGYVVQTSSGAYRLTFKFCSLSQKIINNVSILPLVLPHLRKLSMSVQEIVHFVIQDNTNTVYLDRLEPPNSNYRSTVNIGMRRPLHTSAGGKIILSSQGPEAWHSYWDNADTPWNKPPEMIFGTTPSGASFTPITCPCSCSYAGISSAPRSTYLSVSW